MIRDGEVKVNGRIVTELGTRADPERDSIKVNGRALRPPGRREYLAYNKPVGVVTTMSDPEGRPCLGDLAESLRVGVYPIGRLDFHSSGLLLLTNDGDLAARLMHPRHHVEKSYVVKVSREPNETTVKRLREGVRLDDGVTAPAYVRVTRRTGGKAWIDVRITEGRNRQIRRMLEKVGIRVEKLRRTGLGPVKLGRLPTGGVRRLTDTEVEKLRRAVGLA